MILVNVQNKAFEEYRKSLTQTARRQYREMIKRNKDLTYKKIPFDREEIAYFMDMWEQQLIRGKRRHWAFSVEYPEKVEINGRLMCFAALKGEEKISIHFVENHDGYIECHPPMWDKTKYSKRYLGKFMWFSLIKYALREDSMNWIDLGGGGGDNSWREVVKDKGLHPHSLYKWIYVPKDVKKYPKKRPDFFLRRPQGALGDIKYLEEV